MASGRNIVGNGLDEAAPLANLYGSKAPGSFFTVPVDPTDTAAALETAATWGLRHGDDACVVVCRLPSSTVADLEAPRPAAAHRVASPGGVPSGCFLRGQPGSGVVRSDSGPAWIMYR